MPGKKSTHATHSLGNAKSSFSTNPCSLWILTQLGMLSMDGVY